MSEAIPQVRLDDIDAAIPRGVGVFLDTSIQVVRHFGLAASRWAIEQVCSDRPVYTSSTVFREFHGAMLCGLQHVADILRDVPKDALRRLSDVNRIVADRPGLYGERRAKRIGYIVGHIQDLLFDEEEHDPYDVADLCEAEIARFRRQRFFRVGLPAQRSDLRLSNGYIDVVDCSVAALPLDPARLDARRMSCNKRTRSCSVRTLLGTAGGCLATLPAEWKVRRPKPAQIADAVAAWPIEEFSGKQAVGQEICWPLADVIIAHECPAGVIIMATDRDFLYIVPEDGRRQVLLVTTHH